MPQAITVGAPRHHRRNMASPETPKARGKYTLPAITSPRGTNEKVDNHSAHLFHANTHTHAYSLRGSEGEGRPGTCWHVTNDISRGRAGRRWGGGRIRGGEALTRTISLPDTDHEFSHISYGTGSKCHSSRGSNLRGSGRKEQCTTKSRKNRFITTASLRCNGGRERHH